MRLDVYKLAACLATFGFALLACFCGTLLFFRELEINRQLLDRALDAEIRGKLLASGIVPMRSWTPSAPHPVAKDAPVKEKEAPAPVNKPSVIAATAVTPPAVDEETEQEAQTSGNQHAADPTESNEAQRVGARVGELTADCTGQSCDVDLSLLPTSPGIAKGQLLLVLETEIPRIGTGDPSSPLRKRYYLYPGYTTRDELPPESLSTAEAKAFHFARGLHTHATFNVGKLLRPLAINAYLFDEDKNLLSHERKVIDSDE